MDYICYLVLLHTIGCLIADQSAYALKLTEDHVSEIYPYFESDSLKKIEDKLSVLIRLITKECGLTDTPDYFISLSKDYAFRIFNGIRYHNLENVFL